MKKPILSLMFVLFFVFHVSLLHGEEIVKLESKNSGKMGFLDREEDIPVFVFTLYMVEEVNATSTSMTWDEVAHSEKEKVLNFYIYKTPVAPGNPVVRNVVRKPAIYKSIQQLERYYNKLIKNKLNTEQDAVAAFLKVLKVARAAILEDTQEFEEILESYNQIEQVAQIFDKAIIKSTD